MTTVGPRQAALFVVQCSRSMEDEHTLLDRETDDERVLTGLELAQAYIKAKISHRLLRDLRTTPCGVLLFGRSRTKNILSTRLKDKYGASYDKAKDDYRGCYELFPLKEQAVGMLDLVDSVEVDESSDKADIVSALACALTMFDVHAKSTKYDVREVFLFTDGETYTDWDDLDTLKDHFASRNVLLSVIGIDFDEPGWAYKSKSTSENRRVNEDKLRLLARGLPDENKDDGSGNDQGNDEQAPRRERVFTGARALAEVSAPSVRTVNSTKMASKLRLAYPAEHKDQGLELDITLQKAVAEAPIMTTRKMGIRGGMLPQSSTGASQAQQQRLQEGQQSRDQGPAKTFEHLLAGAGEDYKPSDAALRDFLLAQEHLDHHKTTFATASTSKSAAAAAATAGAFTQGEGEPKREIGLPLLDFAFELAHSVIADKTYYRHEIKLEGDRKPKTTTTGEGGEEGDDGDEEQEADAEDERVEDPSTLVDAYRYGGSLIPTGHLANGAGEMKGLEEGFDILGTVYLDQLRPDWRFGDVYYVYGAQGRYGHQRALSALIHALVETHSAFLVRFVGKGMTRDGVKRLPDPRIGALVPHIDNERFVGKSPAEYLHYISLPFAEDMRPLAFPSFDRVFDRRGRLLTEHKLAPNEEQQEAMDAFVDDCDLMTADFGRGAKESEWFSVDKSYSPAIHNLQAAVTHRIAHPQQPTPAPSSRITRFLRMPVTVEERCSESALDLKDVMDIRRVPPKPKKRKKDQVPVTGEVDQDMDIDDLI